MKRIGLLSEFTQHTTKVLQTLEDICLDVEYEVELLKDFDEQETVAGAVLGLINLCDVLVAIVSKNNGSICYQIGLAHGVGKPVIIITDSESELPPEIRGQRVLAVSGRDLSSPNFHFQLREAIEDSVKRNSGYLGPRDESTYPATNYPVEHLNSFRSIFAAEGPRRIKLFEHWFSEIASKVEGWEVIGSEVRSRGERIFDLVIWNSLKDSELSVLGNPIAVEMKAIGSMKKETLHQFLHSSKKAGINGLILATTGVNDSRTRNLLKRLRTEENVNAIALDRNDLISVRSPDDLLALVKTKVRELLYGKDL